MTAFLNFDTCNASSDQLNANAGSSRAGILFLNYYTTSGSTVPTSFLWGAYELHSGNLIDSAVQSSGTEFFHVYAYFVDESEIATYNAGVIVPTYSASVLANRVEAVFFSAAPQIKPTNVVKTNSLSATSLSAPVTIATGEGAAASVLVDYNISNTGITWNGSWNERADGNNSTSYRKSVASIVADGSQDPAPSWTAAEEATLIVVALGAGGSVAPIVAYYQSMQD